MKADYANHLIKLSQKGYERIAHDFSQTRKVFWEELWFLRELIAPQANILDVGCGNGRFFELIGEKPVSYTGIDFSLGLIKRAERSYGNRGVFLHGDALHLPFPKNQFNTIVSFGVWHHIPSKELRNKFISEISRTLEPGGLLILTVWNLWKTKRTRKKIFGFGIRKIFGKTDLDFKDVLLDFGKEKEVRYLHAFTHKELKRSIEEAGFTIERMQGIKRRSGNENFLIIAKKR